MTSVSSDFFTGCFVSVFDVLAGIVLHSAGVVTDDRVLSVIIESCPTDFVVSSDECRRSSDFDNSFGGSTRI
ncbi:unnamed protein product [Rotaria sp. Silwood2]|nr:unnamed protein product [Rotaria sp. Silwood2]CAF3059180.1 unnamed protein product [Rotaria sp. Silwood2]CAF3388670.1 unnamed protein product [Rotaria sp. Silwood2]CAF4080257.1 unnamed protein product [Rotaria sp. Silwood2]CAF4275192.1 unnamed protein product [Rotaria sp. Silwood2]